MSLSKDWSDGAVRVRDGEDLDLAALAVYLDRRHPELAGEVQVDQFPSGYSNLTYLVTTRRGDGTRREMVLRRPPFGSRVKTAHDMGREYRILAALEGFYSKAPAPLFYCEDSNVLGAPFYAMERRRGLILRGGLSARQPPRADVMRRIGEAFVSTLVELHGVDYRAAGLSDLGRPVGYVGRQLGGWSERWKRARLEAAPEMERVAAWLLDSSRPETGSALVHNDFKYDNLVLSAADPTEVVAVLDWEMTTLGDPMMDLGTTLGYWADPEDDPVLRQLALSPTLWPGNPSRREVAELYATQSGRDLSDLVFYYVFGLFKIAVIIQQIYYRYRQGRTADARFAALGEGVRALAKTALRAIEADRVDHLGVSV